MVHKTIYTILLTTFLNNLANGANIEDLAWMTGSWSGTFGPLSVEESWMPPRAGTMGTLVRLSSAQGTSMIELIVIREEGDTLRLHLRQFSPELELRLAQDMRMKSLDGQSVRFIAEQGESIRELAYRRESPDRFVVDVTTADGAILTAEMVAQ